ncbi:hypothetical protein DM826_02100 [Halonotius aquaticus]|uniref:Uncharacterized protein n=1 Tax=Halonotius aquaticus TaxID=2216978 RepID=A0A3A6Q531_9EURY|nr:hypothetical protein [Halonotius aquaticus]RJX44432.1 hypothetical protein DM826_02100 [Halonotius aquaticus]
MSVMLWTVGAFVVNLLLGIGLLLGVYKFMERRVTLGALSGIVVGTGVIYAQATLGEQWLTVTVSEMKLLVIAACLGAVIGVVGTVLTVKPDL